MASISSSVRPAEIHRLNPSPSSSGTPSAAYVAPPSPRAASTRRSRTASERRSPAMPRSASLTAASAADRSATRRTVSVPGLRTRCLRETAVPHLAVEVVDLLADAAQRQLLRVLLGDE